MELILLILYHFVSWKDDIYQRKSGTCSCRQIIMPLHLSISKQLKTSKISLMHRSKRQEIQLLCVKITLMSLVSCIILSKTLLDSYLCGKLHLKSKPGKRKSSMPFLQPLWGQFSWLQCAQPQYIQLHVVSLQSSWSSKWFLRREN